MTNREPTRRESLLIYAASGSMLLVLAVIALVFK